MTVQTLASVLKTGRDYGLSRLEVMIHGQWVKADFRQLEAPPAPVSLTSDGQGGLRPIEELSNEDRENALYWSSG